MKSKKQINPVEALAKMQRDKMGMAEGSMLKGGRTKYATDEPKPSATAAELLKGKEQFDKIQQYSKNYNNYNKKSSYGLQKQFEKRIKRGEVSQKKVDGIIEVNKMDLPWDKFKGGW